MSVVRVNGVDELVAAVPHLLGFRPRDSLVVIPLGAGPPVARVDLPATDGERRDLEDQLVQVYLGHADPRVKLAVLCFTDDPHVADLVGGRFSDRLRVSGVDVAARLWVQSDRWTDLDTGRGGVRTADAQSRLDATFVVAGRRAPAADRSQLAAELRGDRSELREPVTSATARASRRSPGEDRDWASARITAFERDLRPLSTDDAARLLVSLSERTIRDAALMRINPSNAETHRALWTDLVRRAPDAVRAEPAAVLGFACWLGGDGARAWTALDAMPEGQGEHRLGALVTQVLTEAVPPTAWTSCEVPYPTETRPARPTRPGQPPPLAPPVLPPPDAPMP